MNRGADRQDIFSCDPDRHMFEHQMGDLVDRGLIEIHAFALMDNHFHLLARSLRGEISVAMHRLGSEYARWYNREHRRDGPLFRNRFVSVPVENDEQFLVAARYIHRNPKAMVPIRALAAYRWSSLGGHLGTREAPAWLERELLDELMGGAEPHRRFVESAHWSDDDELWLPFRDGIDAADLEAAIEAVTGSRISASDKTGRRRSDAFTMLLVLALEFRCESADQLAQRYGLASAAAVRTCARRGRVRLVDDPDFARLRARVVGALTGSLVA
jgi:REP element-mobilizing transposase RayT